MQSEALILCKLPSISISPYQHRFLHRFEVGVFGKRNAIRLKNQSVAVIAVDLREGAVYRHCVAAALDGLLPLRNFYRDVSVHD